MSNPLRGVPRGTTITVGRAEPCAGHCQGWHVTLYRADGTTAQDRCVPTERGALRVQDRWSKSGAWRDTVCRHCGDTLDCHDWTDVCRECAGGES